MSIVKLTKIVVHPSGLSGIDGRDPRINCLDERVIFCCEAQRRTQSTHTRFRADKEACPCQAKDRIPPAGIGLHVAQPAATMETSGIWSQSAFPLFVRNIYSNSRSAIRFRMAFADAAAKRAGLNTEDGLL
jgi:hypothetical protein